MCTEAQRPAPGRQPQHTPHPSLSQKIFFPVAEMVCTCSTGGGYRILYICAVSTLVNVSPSSYCHISNFHHNTMSSTTKVDNSINNSDVVQKYRTAGEIAAFALAAVKAKCIPGAKVYDLCVFGDSVLEEKLSEIYNNKKTSKIPKGIAFPTTVSPNNIAAHLSPINADEPFNFELKQGDLVKIQLGAHVDGFASITAETVFVGEGKPTGRVADLLAAAHYASEAAVRTLSAGNRNWDVTTVVDKISKVYGVNALEGMLSHNQEKDVLNGPKEIILNPNETHRAGVESFKFEDGQVYGLDILISSGEGKVKDAETRTSIYKLTGSSYALKLKAARTVLNEAKEKAPTYPFAIRSFSEPTKKMGFQECVNHQVMNAYDVVQEKEGEYIAQFFTTVAITKNGNIKFAAPSFDIESVDTDKKIEDESILEVLAKPLKAANKKKSAKKA